MTFHLRCQSRPFTGKRHARFSPIFSSVGKIAMYWTALESLQFFHFCIQRNIQLSRIFEVSINLFEGQHIG